MSFGFSLSDFYTLFATVNNIRKRSVAAPAQCKDILDEVECFADILQDIQSRPDWRQNEKQSDELHKILNYCQNELDAANEMLEDFVALAPATPHGTLRWTERAQKKMQKVWKQTQWDPCKVQYHRDRIMQSLAFLRAFQERLDREKDRRPRVLDWISRMDYDPEQRVHLKARPQGTGEWFLHCAGFQTWLSGEGTVLLHGIPGAGKTTLAAVVIDHLCQRYENETSVGIAYIYCDFKRSHEQTHPDLIASILKQLTQQRASIPENVRRFYDRHEKFQRLPSIKELSEELETVIGLFAKVFIVIDALDECQEIELVPLLTELSILQERQSIKLLVTSRYPQILTRFSQYQTLEIRAQYEDIFEYVQVRVEQFQKFVSQDRNLQEKIAAEIATAIDGMFLLVQFYIDHIATARTPKKMETILNDLPRGSDAYKKTYNEVMSRIEGRPSKHLARNVLALVTFAKRPLSILEVQHALATEHGVAQLDLSSPEDTKDIVSACEGLVLIDEESGIIRLVHRTAQEYLEQHRSSVRAKGYLGKTCVAYLSLDVFGSGRCLSDEAFESRLQSYPFFDYASRYWGLHVSAASIDSDCLVLNLLQDERKIHACSQAMLAPRGFSWKGYSQRVADDVNMMHVAAYFGLCRAMEVLKQNHGAALTLQDSHGRTPLSWSADHGNVDVTRQMLEVGYIDVDSEDQLGRTPMLWAAINGHQSLVELLICEGNDNVGWEDKSCRTAFSWAAGNGHNSLIRFLLDVPGVDADDQDGFGRTPLSWAAENGSEAVVQTLLHAGELNIDSKDHVGRTPFSHAAENGQIGVINLLLDAGDVNVGSRDSNQRTPLSWAAESGHHGVVERLLRLGRPDINSKDRHGRTAISWAAENGHTAVVKVLLESEAVEVDLPDILGHTPLLWAAQYGRTDTVELLINSGGARVCMADSKSRTALSWAARKGHVPVVEFLLRVELINADARDANGRTALSWAAGNGHTSIVQAFLGLNTVEVDSQDACGRTPLSWAAENGQSAVVQLLLNHQQVNADSKDGERRTPLSWAAGSGQITIVDLLIRLGKADIFSRDHKGRTPLWLAASKGHGEIVRKLAPALDIPDYWDRTPLRHAEEGAHENVISLLRSLRAA